MLIASHGPESSGHSDEGTVGQATAQRLLDALAVSVDDAQLGPVTSTASDTIQTLDDVR